MVEVVFYCSECENAIRGVSDENGGAERRATGAIYTAKSDLSGMQGFIIQNYRAHILQ